MLFKKSLERNRRRSRGTVVVEFCVCITLIITMTFSIAQYGFIMTTLDYLTQVDREAARWSALHYDDPAFTGSATTAGSLKAYVATIMTAPAGATKNVYPIAFSDIVFPTSPNYYSPATTASTFGAGNPITITLQYDMSKKYFFRGFLPGTSSGTDIVTRQATMLME